jgi:hypothetical protein
MRTSYLARIPSWLFGLVYLLLIPAFAGIYLSFANEFFHATTQHEEYVKGDEREILAELRRSMISSFVDAYGSRSLPDSTFLNWDYIDLYDLQYKDGYYSFALLADTRGRVERLPPSALRLRFTLFWARTRPGDAGAKMYGLTQEHEDKGDFMRKMFPINKKFSDEHQSDSLGFVVLPDILERQLLAWAEARSGFPSRSPATFWRLLYFSAITITTVGYGDILPVTTRARLWVGSEAVLGIVLIGLFLNSLAIKAQRQGPESGSAT